MKFSLVVLISLIIAFFMVGSVVAQAPGTTSSNETDQPSEVFESVPIQYNSLYASASRYLWLVDSGSGSSTYIGPIGVEGTDIAFSGTDLFGVSFRNLLRINPTTGTGQVVGYTGFNDVNALAVALDGNVYAATVSGAFLRLNKTTGQGTLIGFFGSGLGSSGDLAIRDDGVVFAALNVAGRTRSWLATVSMVNGTATLIGDIGFADVWGLSFKDGQLYGVTERGDILRINTTSGQGTRIGTSTARFWGLSTSGKALSGNITLPLDNSSIGSSTLQIAAEASYAGGNGVRHVEFLVFFDGIWHSIGIDTSSPYGVSWRTPDNLATQQLELRIDVVGNDGTQATYAGGVRRVNFVQSLGDPNVVENWVSTRAYLNQRSLSPNGDSKCSASSMAMALAMEGVIGLDYQSMANKANEMYPNVLVGNTAYVYKMRDELRRQGAESEYEGPLNASTAWESFKAEIDRGHPVVIRPRSGVVTPAGHIVTGIGYQEVAGKRYLITYDPFGRWLGLTCQELGQNCSGNYDRNTLEPTSDKGKWVYYDFDKFSGGSDIYLITVHNPTSIAEERSEVLTPPDRTSAEPPNIGSYQGTLIIGSESPRIFLPNVIRQRPY